MIGFHSVPAEDPGAGRRCPHCTVPRERYRRPVPKGHMRPRFPSSRAAAFVFIPIETMEVSFRAKYRTAPGRMGSSAIMAEKNGNTSANLGFEDKLWKAADALRSNMDAAEYKHVVLGLIFLNTSRTPSKSNTPCWKQNAIKAPTRKTPTNTGPSIFLGAQRSPLGVPAGKRKAAHHRQDGGRCYAGRGARQPSLKGVLPKDYAHPRLDKQRLGQLIDMIGNIGLGDKANRSKDILGRVYEYFLSQFASAEGKKGGQFYTPRCIVQLLVEMLTPYKGHVYDPCCGSGGMFVQSEKFVEAHGGRVGDIYVFGQESNHTTWKLARMNLAIRGIDGNLGPEHADSFHRDLHPDLKADYVLANPPFNDSDWGGELLRDDKRWQFGTPPAGNANFAWVQHFIHHLAPAGMAGFVLANGSMSSNQSGEGEIRKAIVEADLVDCMVALPGQLFYSTQIPVCLWFVARRQGPLAGGVSRPHPPPRPPRRDPLHRRPQAGHADRPGASRTDRRGYRPDRRHLPRLARGPQA